MSLAFRPTVLTLGGTRSAPASIHGPNLGTFSYACGTLSAPSPFTRIRWACSSIGATAGTAALGAGRTEFLRLTELPNGGTLRPRRRTGGLYHFALLLPSRRALAAALMRLIQTRTQLQGFADHSVSEAIYLADPDGHGIELYSDRPRADWRLTADGRPQMGTDPLDVDGLLALVVEKVSPAGIDPGTALGHMHLSVSHLEPAVVFYRDVLGLDMVMTDDRSVAFLSAGGYHHHLGLNTWAGVGAPPTSSEEPGLDHFEVRLSTADEIERLAGRLERANVPLERRGDGLMARDPGGNGVLLTHRPAS